MQQTKRYSKVFIAFILLVIMTGMTIRSKGVLSQGIYIKTANTALASAPVTHEIAPTTQSPRTRILFTGDINLGRCIAKRTLVAHGYTNNYNYPFQFVAEELNAADIAVGSLDSSLSDEAPPMPCPASMNLISPRYMVGGLQYA